MVMIYISKEWENDCFEGQIVKTQNLVRRRPVGQKDNYFRSYMTRKTSVILYELLYASVF